MRRSSVWLALGLAAGAAAPVMADFELDAAGAAQEQAAAARWVRSSFALSAGVAQTLRQAAERWTGFADLELLEVRAYLAAPIELAPRVQEWQFTFRTRQRSAPIGVSIARNEAGRLLKTPVAAARLDGARPIGDVSTLCGDWAAAYSRARGAYARFDPGLLRLWSGANRGPAAELSFSEGEVGARGSRAVTLACGVAAVR